MPPFHAFQATFAAGEVAPGLYARTDLQKYGSGARRLRNMLVSPTGGAYNRQGLRFIALAKDSAHPVRLIPFEFSSTQAYIIEMGHLYARFYFNGGQVQVSSPSAWVTGTSYAVGNFVAQGGLNYYCLVAHVSGTFATDLANGDWVQQNVYEIPTPWAGADLAGLKFTQSADVMYFVHGSYAIQTLTRFASASWQVAPFSFQNGPWMLQNTAPGQTVTPSAIKNTPVTDNITSVIPGSGGYSTGPTRYSYILELATPHGFYEGQATTIAGLNGAVAAALNGNTYSAHILSATRIQLYVLGTTTKVVTTTSFTTYTPATGTATIPGVGGGITLTSSTPIFDNLHVGALWQIIHTISSQSASNSFTATGNGTSIKCGTTWTLLTSGAWTATVVIEMSTDGGVNWITLQSFSNTASTNYNTTGQTGVSQCLIRARCSAFTSGTATFALSSNSFDWIGVVQITSVTDAQTALANVQTILGDTTATNQWSEGAWSNYRGWPTACAFYQDRLWFAMVATVYASQTSSYANFGVSVPLVDSDSININLPSQKLNAVQHLIVLRDLIALTTSTDWAIMSSSGVLAPTTVEVVAQGQRGASAAPPVVSGIRVVLVQPMGTVVRDLAFSIYSNSYAGENISLISSHLFSGYTIVDVAYQQEPDSIIWMVRSDGKLLSLTYLPEQEVVAWTHHDTAGLFEFIASIPANAGGYNQLWALVNRGGVRSIELLDKRMASSYPEDQFFVDCGLTLDNPVAITAMTKASPVVVTAPAHGFSNGDTVDIDDAVTGMELWTDADGNPVPTPQEGESVTLLLRKTITANGYVVANVTADTFELNDSNGSPIDGTKLSAYAGGGNVRKQVTAVSGLPSNLEGKTVSVLANGFVQNQKVVAGGAITLDTGASRVQVGLPYVSDLETLSLEVPQQDGTLQGRRVKISEVTLRLLNTSGGKVMQGSAARNLDEITEVSGVPSPTPGKARPLFTGDLPRMSVAGGYDYGARVWIRQSDPLPLNVLGIMPNLEVGG